MEKSYSTDDLARAVLLRIVPTGYRLIDDSDERFAGVRDKFVRLALKHLGPKPMLVGFVDADSDAREAALAAAGWASRNLVPNAIQKKVSPGVLVVAVGAAPGPRTSAAWAAGPVQGAAVSSVIWSVGPGGQVQAHGRRPPGSPSPSVVRDAAQRLERGEPAPGIGQVDYVERNLMYGRGRRAAAAGISGTAVILIIVGVFFGLRLVPGLLAGARQPQGSNPCAQGCTIVTPAQNGATLGSLSVGQTSTTFLFRGAGACPVVVDTSVLQQASCSQVSGADSGIAATYLGVAPGTARIAINAGNQGYSVSVLVQ